MKNRRRLVAGSIAAVALLIAGCLEQDASKTDIGEPQFRGDAIPADFAAEAPEVLTVFQNVDNHPTIVRVCLDGVAFRTVSTNHQNGFTSAVERVPEWDEVCP